MNYHHETLIRKLRSSLCPNKLEAEIAAEFRRMNDVIKDLEQELTNAQPQRVNTTTVFPETTEPTHIEP